MPARSSAGFLRSCGAEGAPDRAPFTQSPNLPPLAVRILLPEESFGLFKPPERLRKGGGGLGWASLFEAGSTPEARELTMEGK
jgi:hypothetical protein